ncbi:MAG: BBP7 family outer membrane beta-barrel protein [Planctomycetes bacterium]|nr:BBP7 family outer membrane beta-barrel protein [Planctomycetota bacterium]
MRKGTLGLLAWMFGSAQLFAQTPTVETPSGQTPGAPKAIFQVQGSSQVATEAPIVEMQPYADPGPARIWARGEYLLWWVKNAPIPVPLVTTGDPNDGFPLVNSAGAIGMPATRVLFGGSDVDYGATSGMRFTLGGWVGDNQTFGIEGNAFLLERRTNQFAAGSDALGNPPLYFPAFNVVTGAERALAIADPLRQFSGDVSVTTTLQLWGAEFNALVSSWRRPGLEVSFLAGFRYADLQETLHINNSTNDLLFFNTTVLNDHFDTRNQFYGGQIGVRASWQRDRLGVDVTGKVALGANHQVVNIQGDITQSGIGAFAPGTFPGGLYAQPTNIGRRTVDEFSVLPAVDVRLSYQISQRLRATVGYDFLYWNQVVRPGNQIDRNINPSQSPIFGNGALVGQASPTALFNRSDFWAQGVSFGLEFRY